MNAVIKAIQAAMVLWAVLLLPGAALAGLVVGLEEAVSLALKGNPELRALERSVRADDEAVGIARSALLPKVRLEERYTRTDNPTYAFSSKLNQQRFGQTDFMLDSLNAPDAVGDFQTSVSFEQLIYSRGAFTELEMAKREAGASGFDLVRRRESVALMVTKAFMEVRTAREMVRAAEKGVREAREHKRISQARFEAGLGLYSDTLRTEVFDKEAEERLIRAERAYNVARRALGLALGLEEAVEASDEEFLPGFLGIEHYTAAVIARSDIVAMGKRAGNARTAVRLAGSKYLPTLGIGGSYQYNDHREPFGSEGESYQLTAFLRWDIFDGAMRRHERARAAFKAQEAQERLEGLRKQARFSVYEAYTGVEAAMRSLELAKSRKALAEEGRRLVAERYRNSLSTVVELLDAQTTLDEARAGVVEKTGDYLVAVAALKYQSGNILEGY